MSRVLRPLAAAALLFFVLANTKSIAEVLRLIGAHPENAVVLFATIGIFVYVMRALIAAVYVPRRASAEVAAGVAALRMGPTPEDLETLPRRARHEATHAIAVLALGGHIEQVHTRVTGSSGGQAWWSWDEVGWSAEDQAYANIVALLAPQIVDHETGHRDMGSTADLSRVLSEVLLIMSSGIRPAAVGDDVPLTIDSIVPAARAEAEWIVQENHAAIDEAARRVEVAGERNLRHEDLEDIPVTQIATHTRG